MADLLNLNRRGFSNELLRKVFRMKVQVIVSNSNEYNQLCDFIISKGFIDQDFQKEIIELNPYNNNKTGKFGVSLSTYGLKNYGTKRRIKVQEINLNDYEMWINFKYFRDKVIDISSKHNFD